MILAIRMPPDVILQLCPIRDIDFRPRKPSLGDAFRQSGDLEDLIRVAERGAEDLEIGGVGEVGGVDGGVAEGVG